MKRFSITTILLTVTCSLHAQRFGGNLPSVKWQQLNTDTARIIFPKGLDSQAQRVASVVHYMAGKTPVALGQGLHKIDIVLRNHTTVSNGYVAMAPFRSEFYLTPMQDAFSLGSVSWNDMLAIHEYRHVQQYNNFRNGLTKVLSYILGEEGIVVGTSATVPDWFFEGDAVFSETVLSHQGRGRLPYFLNQYRSLALAGKNYSWMKLRNGSFRDFVPDHYAMGYSMVNYGYAKYGPGFWSKVTQDASAFKGLIYPFQKAIKKHTGVEYKIFREDALGRGNADMPNSVTGDERIATQQQSNQGSEAGITNITIPNLHYVTNYLFPYRINNDSILYLKSSYRHVPSFYIRDSKGEHRLRSKHIAIDDHFSYRNGRIVYAAYQPHARWGWRDYSIIRFIDVHSNEQRQITKRTKYFSPDISEDGSKIVAVHFDESGKSELHLLNTANGEVLQRIRSGEVVLYSHPKFIDNDFVVTAVRLAQGRMALALVDLQVGSTTRLTPLSYNVVGFPYAEKGIVYFTASYEGNDGLYALHLKDRKIYKLTNSPLGNYYASASDGKVLFSSFSAEGFQLKQIDTRQVPMMEQNAMQLEETPVLLPVALSGQYRDILLTDVPPREFAVEKYKRSKGLFNFHSWRPYYEDPEFTFSLYGDNVLNDFSTEIFYKYNENEDAHGGGFDLVYGGLFPLVSGGMEFTFNRPVRVNNTPTFIHQVESRLGLSVPLNITKGLTYKFLNFGSSYQFVHQLFQGAFKDSFNNANYSYLRHFITLTRYIQQAVQHIYPRFGYSLSFNHSHAISRYDSYQFFTNNAVYLPGIHRTHSLQLTGSYQKRDTVNVIFSNRFAISRGYNDFYLGRLGGAVGNFRLPISAIGRLSANYHFPLLYPDWGFANLVYFLRIRANAFYDYTKALSRDKAQSREFKSIGGEIFFDTKWWNQLPVSFGVRYSRLLDAELIGVTNRNVFEFVVPVGIIPD